MKISLNWLNEYVDISEFIKAPEELAEKLTQAGLEVESIENQSEQFKNIVIGEIIEKAQHPDADKLTLCQVKVEGNKVLPIVCGAKNHKQGDKVVVATVGACLPGDFKIKKSKIRGVESQGMLCSEKELGLSEESAGIMILEAKAPVGEAFAKAYGLDDVILDLSVTPNRADCLSHFGLAREIACLTKKTIKMPKAMFVESSKKKTDINVVLKNSEDCPRYMGRSVFNVKVGPSPAWLKQRLESLDVNSINNLVDITNFVMLELGQPMHAFDSALVENQKIEISSSKKGEKFQTLDGTELELTGEELMIRDGSKPVAMAGVIGGKNSGVTESTKNIFLESAHFTPQTVRKSSRRFGIETDSGYRFSRGTDVEMTELALSRACHLIQEIAGGDVASDFQDEYPSPEKKPVIDVHVNFVAQKLGYNVSPKDFEDCMKRVGCEVIEKDEDGHFKFQTPQYRWDMDQDVDLVEEYGRIHGYEYIKETLPILTDRPSAQDTRYLLERDVERRLMECGYMQAVNYNFTSSVEQKALLGDVSAWNEYGLNLSDDDVKLLNPLNEDLDVMRRSHLPELLKNLITNYRSGISYGRIYELGSIFHKQDYKEDLHLSMLSWGQAENLWQKNKKRPVVYDVKSAVEKLLTALGFNSFEWQLVNSAPSLLHPGQCVGLKLQGKLVGIVGTMHPKWIQENKIREDIAFAQINMEMIKKSYPKPVSYKKISKQPYVERDLAFILQADQKLGDILKEIKKVLKPDLKSIEVFDLYQGDKLAQGESSIALKMRFQTVDGTYTDQQLQELMQKAIKSAEKTGAKLR